MKIKNLLLAATAIVAFAMTVTAQTIPSYVPTNGLVGYWPFNSNANDESGNGNNGTVNGATLTSNRFGNANSSYSFDGIDDFIEIPNSSSLSNPNLTIGFWINTNSVVFQQVLYKVSFNTAQNEEYSIPINLNNQNEINFDLKNNSCLPGNGWVYFNNSAVLSNWKHIIFTHDGSITRFFLDGVLINSQNANFNIANCPGGSLILGISWNLQNALNGSLDDIGMWNRALTQQEITNLYLSGQPCPTVGAIQGPSSVVAGNTITLTDTTSGGTWSSSHPAIATVNSSGVVTGVAPGTDTIRYTVNTICGPVTVFKVITVTSACLPSYVPTNGLVGWWPFCGNANDESGNGNHGTVNGATLTSDRNGNSGKAYSFDGVNDFIVIPNSNSLNFSVGTISFWMKSNSISFMQPLKKGNFNNASVEQFAFGVFNGDNQFAVKQQSNCYPGNGWQLITNNDTLNNNQWNHIVGVINNNSFKFYINGILRGQNSLNQNGSDICIGELNIGRNWSSHPIYFNGLIDNISIHNRALTQAEITQLYTNCVATTSTTNLTIPSTSIPYTWNGLTFNAAGSQTKHLTNAAGCDSTATLNLTVINTALPSYLPANGLVGWWPFNGNANDESGNGNHGTVNGATLTTDRNGVAGKAYSFDGVNDNINPLQNNLPFGTTARTISIWFQRIGTGGNLFSYGSANTSNAYMIAIGANIIANQGWTSPDFPVYPSIDNSWHNVVCTFDGLNSTIYLDNSNLGSNPMTGLNTIAGSFYFGTRVLNDMDFFNGKIDDIAIWNRALTQAEISALYQNTIKLNLTTFLEGSYADSSSMTATANKINAAISSSIADSIIVELHASTSPYATMYSSKGVVNTNGTASISFPNSTLDSSYYIVIKHRNSIETWSASPITISNHTIYNFTTSASQAYGANLSNLGKGVFGIYSGDINQDGSIDFNDYPELDIASNLGVLGYDVNDLNGDASVDFNDFPILDVNSNDGIIVVRP
jgi:hypothetical protein